MKSIYDLLLDWHQTDPNFIFLKENRSYTLNEVVHEVESISKSLSYLSSENIAIYLSSKLDFILVYLACINSSKIPIILKTTWGKDEVDSIIDSNNIKHIITGGNYSTECVRNPVEWMYYQSDSSQIKDIHKSYSETKLKDFPFIRKPFS